MQLDSMRVSSPFGPALGTCCTSRVAWLINPITVIHARSKLSGYGTGLGMLGAGQFQQVPTERPNQRLQLTGDARDAL